MQQNFIRFQVCFEVGNFTLLLTFSENVFFKLQRSAVPQLQPIFKLKDHVAFHHKTIVIPLSLLKFDGFLTFIFTVVRVTTLERLFKIGWVQSMILAFVTSTLHTIGKIAVTSVGILTSAMLETPFANKTAFSQISHKEELCGMFLLKIYYLCSLRIDRGH